jgi:hypothetical protein
VKLLAKYFFLADVVFLGGRLRFGQIHFPLADVFYLGVFKLSFSCWQMLCAVSQVTPAMESFFSLSFLVKFVAVCAYLAV